MRHQVAFLLPLLLFFLGCGSNDEVADPVSGSIRVTVDTTGDVVPSGFTLLIDGTLTRMVDANGSVTVTTLAGGEHEVLLSDIATGCTVSGSNPRIIEVVPGETAQAGFSVSCTSDKGPGDPTDPQEPL